MCRDKKDLDRQVIKSDSATVQIPEIDFEIPPMTQKGEISTIEGFLSRAAKNLSMYQDERMDQMPEVGIRVAEVICSLTRMAAGDLMPFTILIDDTAGNSFIENPYAPAKDENMTTSTYVRTETQDLALGLQPETAKFDDQNTAGDVSAAFPDSTFIVCYIGNYAYRLRFPLLGRRPRLWRLR